MISLSDAGAAIPPTGTITIKAGNPAIAPIRIPFQNKAGSPDGRFTAMIAKD
jgi:hypothetical protein